MTILERIPSGVAAPTTTVADVMALARESGVLMVDLRFVDLPGQAQHFSIPVKELGENLFIDGIGFDGSSIRGFQNIHESDMLLMPDPTTAFVDPTLNVPTLILICDVAEPGSREPYSPRPALHRPQGRALPRRERHRDDELLGPRDRVLHLQLAPLRPDRPPRLCTTSTPKRASGTPAGTARRTSATGRGQRRATSRSRRSTSSRTCARRWCSTLQAAGHRRRGPPPRGRHGRARPRSTCASARSSRRPTRSSSTSTSSADGRSRRARS